MKKPGIFLFLFALAALTEVVIPYSTGLSVHFITKPLILISLIFYYLTTTRARQPLFLTALFACLIGDVLLLMETWHAIFFMLGLLSFLAAHVFLSVSYGQQSWKKMPDAVSNVQKARLSFPIILAGTGLLLFLYPTLGSLKVPVMIYSLILVIMVLCSVARMGRTSPQSFWFVFSGAVLFMISDSVLAINKFATPVPQDSLLIMGTYSAAQFFIVLGMLKHQEQPA